MVRGAEPDLFWSLSFALHASLWRQIRGEFGGFDFLSSAEVLLFSESPSRIVISFAAEDLDRVREIAGDCPFEVIGKVGDDVLKINVNGTEAVNGPVSSFEGVWETSLERRLTNGV